MNSPYCIRILLSLFQIKYKKSKKSGIDKYKKLGNRIIVIERQKNKNNPQIPSKPTSVNEEMYLTSIQYFSRTIKTLFNMYSKIILQAIGKIDKFSIEILLRIAESLFKAKINSPKIIIIKPSQ